MKRVKSSINFVRIASIYTNTNKYERLTIYRDLKNKRRQCPSLSPRRCLTSIVSIRDSFQHVHLAQRLAVSKRATHQPPRRASIDLNLAASFATALDVRTRCLEARLFRLVPVTTFKVNERSLNPLCFSDCVSATVHTHNVYIDTLICRL